MTAPITAPTSRPPMSLSLPLLWWCLSRLGGGGGGWRWLTWLLRLWWYTGWGLGAGRTLWEWLLCPLLGRTLWEGALLWLGPLWWLLSNSNCMGAAKSGAAAEAVLMSGVDKNKAAKAIAMIFLEFFNIIIPSFFRCILSLFSFVEYIIKDNYGRIMFFCEKIDWWVNAYFKHVFIATWPSVSRKSVKKVAKTCKKGVDIPEAEWYYIKVAEIQKQKQRHRDKHSD